MSLENEAVLLAQKEAWIKQTAARIHATRGIDLASAEAAARWASIWVDNFKLRFDEHPPDSTEGVKALLGETKQLALELTEGVERYPTGLPSMRALMAVEDAFCIAYGDEEVRQLLK